MITVETPPVLNSNDAAPSTSLIALIVLGLIAGAAYFIYDKENKNETEREIAQNK